MNSNFSLKSSIALLVLGVSIIGSPKHSEKSTLAALVAYQPEIAAAAVKAIVNTMRYQIA